jgi:hypothetical protein
MLRDYNYLRALRPRETGPRSKLVRDIEAGAGWGGLVRFSVICGVSMCV